MLVGWKHMIGKIRTLGAGWLLLCGTWTHQAAHAQSRSDLIESARAEKEARLKPETPPKGEKDIVWAQNSLVYRLLTEQLSAGGHECRTPARVSGAKVSRRDDRILPGDQRWPGARQPVHLDGTPVWSGACSWHRPANQFLARRRFRGVRLARSRLKPNQGGHVLGPVRPLSEPRSPQLQLLPA